MEERAARKLSHRICRGDALHGLVGEDGVDPVLGVVDVLAQEFLGEEVSPVARRDRVGEHAAVPLPHRGVHCDVGRDGVIQVQCPALVQRFRLHVRAGPPVLVRPQHVLRQAAIQRRVELVQHDEQQVETGEQGVWKADVLLWPPVGGIHAR